MGLQIGYKATRNDYFITDIYFINMTRTEFYIKACLAFAGNHKLMADNLTAAQCINNITGLAEALTLKVEESADFDPEYSLQ